MPGLLADSPQLLEAGRQLQGSLKAAGREGARELVARQVQVSQGGGQHQIPGNLAGEGVGVEGQLLEPVGELQYNAMHAVRDLNEAAGNPMPFLPMPYVLPITGNHPVSLPKSIPCAGRRMSYA